MDDRRADAVVIVGLAMYAGLIGYGLYRDPALAVIAAIIVAAVSVGAVWWLSD